MKTPFLKGVSYGFMAPAGTYRSEAAQREVEAIHAIGANAVALIVTVVQERYSSTRMVADFRHTPGDLEIAGIIDAFHRRGIRVMLKPMIECLDSVWRGHIRFPPTQQMVQGVQTAEVIARVRSEYTGPVTYNADQFRPGQPFVRNWFRLLDLLGVSFYSGVPDVDPDAEKIAEGLHPVADALEAVSQDIGLPLFFAECGARSVAGGTREPWRYDVEGAYDGAAQANYLEGVLKAFSARAWWRGLLWWKWDEQQRRPHYNQPGGDTGFTIAGKPAAAVFRRWTASS